MINDFKETIINLNKPQKIFLGLIIIIFSISLSIAVLSLYISPVVTGKNFLLKIYNTILFIHYKWSINLPILAIQKGFILEVLQSLFIGTLISSLLSTLGIYSLLKNSEKKNIHGKAKWSNEKDLIKGNLMAQEGKGIIVGKHKGKILRFGGQEFASLGAPTRSGKGVGVVIPNLLEWDSSIVVLDVKKECFNITSKYREEQLGQKVYIFDPFSYKTHRYNPLLYLNFESPDIEMQIQSLAVALYPAGKGGKDFFSLQAQSIFVAITYLMGKLYYSDLLACSFTLTSLAGALQGIKIDFDNNEERIPLDEIVETANKMGILTETIYSKFTSFFEQAEAKDQFAGVKSSYETPLKIFQDSLFEMATCENDFDFRDLRKEKISIYIGITPENIAVAQPILNLFFSQLLFENIRQGMPDTNPDLKHNVLLLMDEFTSIGFMEQYQKSVSYMAGYNLRSLIIYQNRTQLAENPPLGYGDKGSETLLENHTCNVIYRPKNPKTAEDISKRVGNITTTAKNNSTSNKDLLNVSRSENVTSRALILPQEIMALKDDEELIFCNSVKIICKKAFFYNDEYFINKLKSVSQTLANVEGFPTKDQLEKAYTLGETSIKLPDNSHLANNGLIF
ncbi:type IV secretory system conjugative DNA transfer family protein [Pasteurella atlantica]|uniref:type IV secretory system conjugative DNA transfer family protein n=1 Tax=Phocoenobacter atlanticus TaxID=3416742 RepID=UPI002759058B|nr:type IV secretory system conjugative DNA transfer family protein [Pasteurella atlantica]MDP8042528.1 type IV secretory system conjugative DNA transfer family protein [Pasteurella atlantica]